MIDSSHAWFSVAFLFRSWKQAGILFQTDLWLLLEVDYWYFLNEFAAPSKCTEQYDEKLYVT